MNSERLRLFVKDVMETPPKMGNQPVKARRSIEQMSEDQVRRRKVTVNALISLLRMALIMAWENAHIDSDRPWRCMRRLPNVVRPRVLHLSREECFRLLDHCEPALKNLVLGALYTGCRATELLRMRVTHVGRDGAGVYVTPVKTYRPRVVLLPDEGLDRARVRSSPCNTLPSAKLQGSAVGASGSGRRDCLESGVNGPESLIRN